MNLSLEGGCLCGAVRYRISGAPRSADYCHCRMCRRAAGAPVVARLTVANGFFSWTRGEPAVYRSSLDAERFFCRECGTQLALRDEPDFLDDPCEPRRSRGGPPDLSYLNHEPHRLVRHCR
jgi:hypothetical protein